MKQLQKDLTALFLLVTALIVPPLIVSAADSHTVPAYGSLQVDEHGICRVVNNNNGSVLFVPTRSSNEWQSFINAADAGQTPNVSLSSCAPSCVSNQGQSCNSPTNACGMINQGTVQCDGSCSASAPSNDACGGGGGGGGGDDSCNEVTVCDIHEIWCQCDMGGSWDGQGCSSWGCGDCSMYADGVMTPFGYCAQNGEFAGFPGCNLESYPSVCNDECMISHTECQ